MSIHKSLETRAASVLGQEIAWSANPGLERAVQAVQRTEDCRFSPGGDLLAVAGYARDAIFVLGLDWRNGPAIVSCLELRDPGLLEPHGLDFIDDRTLAVANRGGMAQVFALPAQPDGQATVPAEVVGTVTRADWRRKLHSPGSVAVANRNAGGYDLLLCNNYRHRVTRHRIATAGGRHEARENRVLAERDLGIPDGIALTADCTVAAVSNHKSHEVFLYALGNDGMRRIGTLKGIDFPHGLRFTADGSWLLVADAGQPFLQVFRTSAGWQGDHVPVRSVRVMDDATYLRGRVNIMEGGIKGLDINHARGLVAVTCEFQPLTFFPLDAVLGLPPDRGA